MTTHMTWTNAAQSARQRLIDAQERYVSAYRETCRAQNRFFNEECARADFYSTEQARSLLGELDKHSVPMDGQA